MGLREVPAPLCHVFIEGWALASVDDLLPALPGVGVEADHGVALLIHQGPFAAHDPLPADAVRNRDLLKDRLTGAGGEEVSRHHRAAQADVGTVVGIVEAAVGDVLGEGPDAGDPHGGKAGRGGNAVIARLPGILRIVEQGVEGIPLPVIGQNIRLGVGLGWGRRHLGALSGKHICKVFFLLLHQRGLKGQILPGGKALIFLAHFVHSSISFRKPHPHLGCGCFFAVLIVQRQGQQAFAAFRIRAFHRAGGKQGVAHIGVPKGLPVEGGDKAVVSHPV